MKTTVKTALLFLALAGIAGSSAAAAERHGQPWRGGMMRGGMMRGGDVMMLFDRAAREDEGDVSYEEFAKAAGDRLAEGRGTMTVAEVADEIIRQRAERRARRAIAPPAFCAMARDESGGALSGRLP